MDNDLIKWIEENSGFIHPDIYIATKKIDNISYRSVYCKNSIKIPKNTRLTKIPHKLILSYRRFKNIPNIDKWSYFVKDEGYSLRLIVALVYETLKKEGSFYYPYIKTLPDYNAFDNHPIYFHYKNNYVFKELEALSVEFTKVVTLKSKKMKKYIYLILLCNKKAPIFSKNISDSELEKIIIWAFLIQVTRTWSNRLIPFNDLFNHDNNSNIFLKTMEEKERFYGFRADSQFEKNHSSDYEIFINYGHYDLMSMQIEYSFVPDNIVNYLRVPITFTADDRFEKLKIKEIKKCNIKPNRILLSNREPSKNLLKIMRIYSLEKDEYELISKKEQKNKYDDIINHKNELRSIAMLLNIILELKKSSYTLDIMNKVHMILNSLSSKKSLSQTDLIIQNICTIKIKEYAIIEDSLNWASDRLSKLMKQKQYQSTIYKDNYFS